MAEARLTPGLNLQAWDEWLGYRQAIGHPFATSQLARQALVLAEHRSYDEQAAAVKHTIDKGWQGLCDAPKQGGSTAPRAWPARPTQESTIAAIEAAERLAQQSRDNEHNDDGIMTIMQE